jgi:hypothetical protein
MFHMEVFRSSLSSGATDVFQQVNYVATNAVLAQLNNGVQVSAELNKLHSLFGVGAHLQNVRAQSPSMLPLPYPTYNPNNIGTAIESPAKFWDFVRAPKPLRPTEEFDIYASQLNAGAETETVFVNFTDGNVMAPPPLATGPTVNGNGQFFIAHATAATTLTANAWTQVTPVLDFALPAGTYALMGARVVTAGCLAFRMLPIVTPLWRPGGVGCQTNDQLDSPGQRFINPLDGTRSHWGVWLTFYQNTVPNVHIWSTSADTAEDMFFDLIKLSDTVTAGAQ